jgi:hypothetical protein
MTTTARTQRDFTLTWTVDSAPAEVFRAWTGSTTARASR